MKNIYLTIILFTVSFYTYAQTAEEYYANGSLKMELENYEESIEDFTKLYIEEIAKCENEENQILKNHPSVSNIEWV